MKVSLKVVGAKRTKIQGVSVKEHSKETLIRTASEEMWDKLERFVSQISNGKYSMRNVRFIYTSDVFGGAVAFETLDGKLIKDPEVFNEGEKEDYSDLSGNDYTAYEAVVRHNPSKPLKEKTVIKTAKQTKRQLKLDRMSVDKALNELDEKKNQEKAKIEKKAKAAAYTQQIKDINKEIRAKQLKITRELASKELASKIAEARAKLEQEKAKMIKKIPQRHLVSRVATKTSADTKLSKAFKSIPYGKAGSVSLFKPEKVRDFLLHIDATVPADVVVPDKKYKIPKVVENSSIAIYGKLKSEEMKKVVFFTWRGCLACATFFQSLVARTPMDEDYSYEEEGIGTDRVKYYSSNGELKSPKQIAKEANPRVKTFKKKHKADAEYVRGDWTITFRGKTFKAFESQPAKDSDHISVDYTFTEDLFEKLGDQSSIFKIADTMFELTKDSGDLSSVWSEFNINPRWQALEFGGWYTHQSKMAKGAKYSHRVDSTLLSYQAPRGFWRITRFEWNELVNTGKWKGSIESYINPRKKKIDVSKVESIAMKSLLEKYPELKNRNTTIGVYK